MKKTLLTALMVAGLSASVLAQGTITLDNLVNSGALGATSGGLIYKDGALWNGSALNITALAGASAGSLSPLATLAGAGAALGAGGGLFLDPNGTTLAVSGVALGGTAWLQLLIWEGSAASYTAAVQAGAYTAASVAFQNPTGGHGAPPALPAELTGMPSMNLLIPEPSTFALLGLGALGMMIFRRK